MSDCGCHIEAQNKEEAKTLWILLAINFAMFVLEICAGVYAQSTALIADSIDMLADAGIYAIGIFAVGRAVEAKNRAARLSGVFQILIGLGIIADIVRRYLTGSDPVSLYMLAVGFVALIANAICLKLIYKHRKGEAHMRASYIFSKNDVIANIGVIIAGAIVFYTHSPLPDLIIGSLISALVVWGGVVIIKDLTESKETKSCS